MTDGLMSKEKEEQEQAVSLVLCCTADLFIQCGIDGESG